VLPILVDIRLIPAETRLAPAAIAFLLRHAIYELIATPIKAMPMMATVPSMASSRVKSKSEMENSFLSSHGLVLETQSPSQLTLTSGSCLQS